MVRNSKICSCSNKKYSLVVKFSFANSNPMLCVVLFGDCVFVVSITLSEYGAPFPRARYYTKNKVSQIQSVQIKENSQRKIQSKENILARGVQIDIVMFGY